MTENRNSGNGEFVEKVAAINVKRAVQGIIDRSPVLKEMIESGAIGIAGAVHDITTGEVSFYDDSLIINAPRKESFYQTLNHS